MSNLLRFKGKYTLVHKDNKGIVLSSEVIENLITDEGKDLVLNTALHGTTGVAVWYFLIFTTGAAAGADTYDVPNRTESTGVLEYTETDRQVWNEGAASGQSVTNGTAATITAGSSGITVLGIGVAGSTSGAAGLATKGDVAAADAHLLSSADVSKTLAQGETLDITYTVNA